MYLISFYKYLNELVEWYSWEFHSLWDIRGLRTGGLITSFIIIWENKSWVVSSLCSSWVTQRDKQDWFVLLYFDSSGLCSDFSSKTLEHLIKIKVSSFSKWRNWALDWLLVVTFPRSCSQSVTELKALELSSFWFYVHDFLLQTSAKHIDEIMSKNQTNLYLFKKRLAG